MARLSLTAQLMVATLVALLARGPALASVPLPWVVAAAAPQGPKVGVAVFSLDKQARVEAGLWEHALEEALVKADRFEVVPSIDLYDGAGAQSRAAKRKDAAARLKDGAKALDDLDNQKATEAFTAAVQELKETDLSRSWPEFLDAVRLKAAGHATGGENAPAKQEMERLLALDPTATLSANYFSPDLLKFAEAQRRSSQGAKGELALKTWPDGAPVWVDGKYRGVAPVAVKGLSGGKHFVTVKLGGFALFQSELAVGEHTLDLKPAQDSGALLAAEKTVTRDPQGSERDAAARAMMKRLGLEQLVAVVLKKSVAGEKVDAVALRLDVKDGHNWAYAQATVGMGDQEAVAALAEKLVAKDEPRKGGPVTHFRGGGGASGTQVAGFALLGVGALAVGTGIFFGVQAQAAADEFKRTPQVQTLKSNDLATQGRTYSVVADVSYIVGGVSLVTGAILAIVGGSSGGGSAEAAPEPKKRPPEGKGSKKSEPEKKSSTTGSGSDFGKKSREDDKRRRDEEDKRRKEDEERRKKEDEERAQKDAAEKKGADDAKAEEQKKKDEEEREAKKDDGKKKKKTKKELLEEKREEEREKKKKEDEARAEEQKRKEEERAAKKKEDEAKAEELKKKAEEEREAKKENKKKTKKEREEEEKRKKEEAAEQKKAEEEKKKADEEAKKREDEAKKKADEEKKKKTDDHDDLRNF